MSSQSYHTRISNVGFLPIVSACAAKIGLVEESDNGTVWGRYEFS